ncbi:MAG: glycyl-radical enzyme activating protein [Deltaproteobacteria bacterium]|nr:glycyl-radical enzyme activating protein [Deltaproteobacteria bacterium]
MRRNSGVRAARKRSLPDGWAARPARARKATTGVIFNIQGFSVHDGGGIRTLVFLKGCPLRCPWCSNPESQGPLPETGFNPVFCLGTEVCGACVAVCPEGRLRPDGAGGFVKGVPPEPRCASCGACVRSCPSGARSIFGREASAAEIVGEARRDSVFFERSGGGITLSGGEPLFQKGFAASILGEARRWGMDTAFETSGAAAPEDLLEAASCASSVIYDLKHWDPARLSGTVGLRDPGLPASNLRLLRERRPDLPVTVRIPVIPGFNDTLRDLLKTASLAPPGLPPPELLPYHRMGESKYQILGREPPFRAEPTDPSAFDSLKTAFLSSLGSGGARTAV